MKHHSGIRAKISLFSSVEPEKIVMAELVRQKNNSKQTKNQRERNENKLRLVGLGCEGGRRIPELQELRKGWDFERLKKNWLHCFSQKHECLGYPRGIGFLRYVRNRTKGGCN